MITEFDGEWLDKYKPFMIPKNKIKLDTQYWVCDIDVACGETQDNVFYYNFSYKGNLSHNGSYLAFKSKKQALLFSKELYKQELKFYK